ncbi:MlaC/ttg2D family ABC transporter substrate-binding protein [Thetidibacter halocola]|uniref:ABC transporter substrate-binding protein n=1 Tax=Thetidibacter halocola TaxID=2827239 RepID=A0A8J7WFA8_9RHOB|nr:ABC transporter substrate-binding protein [Thetidibacter halocola]MBS0124641.1 ABC transporter substrate-binding protein [Thetidibacter halocola]
MPNLMLTRRAALLGAAALGLGAALPTGARAATAAQAESLVRNLVAEINRVIASGKSVSSMIRDFEGIFRRYADLPTIAAYALGADGRRASAAQKKAFTDAFSGYIARKYGKRFHEFIGGRLEVTGSRPIRNAFEVVTTAYLRGEAPFEVSFHIGQNSGRMFNMFIEGVNMLLTERSEIGALLDRNRGDIDAMIAQLRKTG